MSYPFPNTLSVSGIPGGELYLIGADSTAAMYSTKPPLGNQHPMKGPIGLTGTEQTDFTKLFTTDLGL